MNRTPDEEIVQDGWYWVKKKMLHGEPKWEIMQAQVLYYRTDRPNSISWWETMKDWETDHSEILIVGPRIMEPAEEPFSLEPNGMDQNYIVKRGNRYTGILYQDSEKSEDFDALVEHINQ